MSASNDTWQEIQAVKSKRSNLREKLARRKQERQQLLGASAAASTSSATPPAKTDAVEPVSTALTSPVASSSSTSQDALAVESKAEISVSGENIRVSSEMLKTVEIKLLLELNDVTLNLPVEVTQLAQTVSKLIGQDIPITVTEDLIQKFSAQTLVCISTKDSSGPNESRFIVDSVDHSKLTAVCDDLDVGKSISKKRKAEVEDNKEEEKAAPSKQQKTGDGDDLIESLLSKQSAKQKENTKLTDEILDLLSAPTAKEQSLVEKFKSQGGAQVKEFCNHGTKEECTKVKEGSVCDKLHFKKIIHKHTDESLGDCSFLNTCFHMDTCKYVHYEIDYPEQQVTSAARLGGAVKKVDDAQTLLYPPQWVQCDLRVFDMSTLGKFAVVMADPPWDIHMELPYGTMSDDEMRKLNIPVLQDDGYIFLWVTGRAMELGRECLKIWGYERVDEVIWVKTNQLQRIIRTGRTGHWFNHGKEHCLVGVKGNPPNVNKGLDCDVIVAEVRATSHKPDEIYGIIERLSPGSRKIELFGRPHNIQPNWITLGNQTDGVKLLDPDVVKAFRKRYPDGNCLKPPTQQ